MSYQAHWMNQLAIDDRAAGCLPYLQQAGLVSAQPTDSELAQVRAVVAALNERIKLFSDVLTFDFFFKDAIEVSEKDSTKIFAKDGITALLAECRPVLAAIDDWSVASIEAAVRSFCESKSIGAGTLNQPLRISTTGSPIGPGVFDCLALVGQEKSLARIDQMLAKL